MSRKAQFCIYHDGRQLLMHTSDKLDELIERADMLAMLLEGVYEIRDHRGVVVYVTGVTSSGGKAAKRLQGL